MRGMISESDERDSLSKGLPHGARADSAFLFMMHCKCIFIIHCISSKCLHTIVTIAKHFTL